MRIVDSFFMATINAAFVISSASSFGRTTRDSKFVQSATKQARKHIPCKHETHTFPKEEALDEYLARWTGFIAAHTIGLKTRG
mgnify:FL=1